MNYDEPRSLSMKNRLDLEMASWIYQSHFWKRTGITGDNIVCEWCGKELLGPQAMTTKDELCPQNPKIREMRLAWIKNTLKGMEEATKIIVKSREGLCQGT